MDRPLLPREAEAILRRHEADPASTRPGQSRETLSAAERQLRLQADAFAACAAALRAGDAAAVPAGNPNGSGHAEVRELLVDAAELLPLLTGDATAAGIIEREHEALADAFAAASVRCLGIARHLQGERHRIHAADYRRVLVDGLQEDAGEARRRRGAGKADKGASA
ncbi:hypothetical protein [Neoroseomonas soli]|uniref:Uncharacterized protein n=1 Tax=Neoroseomonas soli TaxID=1081025 RepID=A0A9X9WVI8_9PROT|nr:hypothetical protein [Neoroseomonas soli]MBR0671167.1 hypothetical protein [Neoroseomonas soli]